MIALLALMKHKCCQNHITKCKTIHQSIFVLLISYRTYEHPNTLVRKQKLNIIKNAPNNLGLRLQIIRSLAKNHDGNTEFSTEKRLFTLQVVLKWPAGTTES